jgi:RNA polymerase sigma-70 factor (ECF subfamily)
MMEESDGALVARAREGDQEAFRVLVERHSHRLFQLAYHMTGVEQDAEDVVQETFLRAYRYLSGFQSRADFTSWLHRIAINCSFDVLRKRQRGDQQAESLGQEAWEELLALSASTPSPDTQALHREAREQIAKALDLLTPMERSAFVLRHFEDRSIGEISDVLGVGSNAAKQSILRGVQKLRRALTPILNSKQPSPEKEG